MTLRRYAPTLLLPILVGLTACQSGPLAPGATVDPNTQAATPEAIPASLAKNVIIPTYQDLDTAAAALHTASLALQTAPTEATLDAARKAWKAARQPWEISEGHLLGPVKDQDLDPQLDSWPVNRTDLDQVLASQDALTTDFIAKQPDGLKGFHAIEYLLFGAGTQPKATDLTARQLTYLTALTGDFRRVASDLRQAWAADGGNYAATYTAPASAKDTIAETLSAMGEICEEVADSKIETPLAAKDRTLEESQFSNNSFTDFRNNMEGVQNLYLGRYGTTAGQGLSALVLAKDPALDAQVRKQLQTVISGLSGFQVPFGEAITTQPDALKQVQTDIRTLRQLLGQQVSLLLLGTASADKT